MQMNGLANMKLWRYMNSNNTTKKKRKTSKLKPLNVKLYVHLHQLNTSIAHNLSLSLITFFF